MEISHTCPYNPEVPPSAVLHQLDAFLDAPLDGADRLTDLQILEQQHVDFVELLGEDGQSGIVAGAEEPG
ncbi:hypothetical protein [Rhodococcus sp. B50]|uniref:hypothetical protein n=1 Tax=Rhodococcus sp. B50 TaxID=2682847 RepID=UPI0019E5DA78|nr:hypothetical protein [Rhodococcus sp. B50]MBS9376248.1 hypothetical protein [Rhodococcus sp. B50]